MRGSLFFNRRMVLRCRQIAISTVGSMKIKILLSCCIGFTLFALASRASDYMGWTNPNASVSRLDDPRKGYAIVMNTWKRYDLLKQSISHYTTCDRLNSIHIVWSEPNPPSDDLKKFFDNLIQSKARNGRQLELKFEINTEDSLNNRFKEIKDLKTDAIFSIDDDIIFPCNSVEFAFKVWQSAPDTMVGFVPRVHWVDKTKGTLDSYEYGGWWSVWWTGTYSMILSKAAFFHKKYLINSARNCEDIAMSFLVANATGAPPIWVKGKIFEIGSTGISSLGGHIDKRTQCVNRFVAEFGRMPLQSTNMKAVDSRKTWFW
ncbi:hypothetical protein FEM48_Zijuj03G0102700 [Ziziphus jujuba var. spinosa]|uniref:Glycosyl transferase 64 domain-containing protein n=1 Tax=Ziziphus jujuba var. spinosa TaxID=714518 RepID=A0A978VPQ3_ZIZJJ|nr:hypothetical protein FEM48_Zijuj03G0102700 [Ziziphus jujuba var. spinosa]